MDTDLRTKLGDAKPEHLAIADAAAGTVKLPDGTDYALKPLKQLYAADPANIVIDPQNERYLQLLLAYEATILEHDHRVRGLTDGAVLLAVEQLALNPDADPKGDAVFAAIQLRLRALLSLADYGRQEVRQAARKVAKSIQGHSKRGGNRAYLGAIHGTVPHHHH